MRNKCVYTIFAHWLHDVYSLEVSWWNIKYRAFDSLLVSHGKDLFVHDLFTALIYRLCSVCYFVFS
jgi:hypothetical protein